MSLSLLSLTKRIVVAAAGGGGETVVGEALDSRLSSLEARLGKRAHDTRNEHTRSRLAAAASRLEASASAAAAATSRRNRNQQPPPLGSHCRRRRRRHDLSLVSLAVHTPCP